MQNNHIFKYCFEKKTDLSQLAAVVVEFSRQLGRPEKPARVRYERHPKLQYFDLLPVLLLAFSLSLLPAPHFSKPPSFTIQS